MKNLWLIFALFLGLTGRTFSQTFTDSNLPIVVINTDGGSAIPDEPGIMANMKIIYRGEGLRNYLSDQNNDAYLNYKGRVDIEIRGSSTQSIPKKQYGFTTKQADNITDQNVSLMGIPAENDWVLNAMGFDPHLIRDYICYNIIRKLGEYSSRTAYCEVVINNSYQGLFLLQEKIKADPNRLDVMRIQKSDFFFPNLTGGYITKSDKETGGDQIAWGMQTNVPGIWVSFIHELPQWENVISVQNNYIKGEFEKLNSLALSGNAGIETGYPSVIDIPSFVNYMIIAELSSNADSYQFSTYYHKDRNGKLRAGPIWDNDLTFGNDLFHWGYDRSKTNVWQFSNGDNEGPPYWKNLYFNSVFKCCLRRRWAELTQPGGILNYTTLTAFIDETASYITEAVTRNNLKWSNFKNFSQGISDLKAWLNGRIAWMNNNIGSASGCPDPVIPPLVITKIMYSPVATPATPDPNDLEFVEITNTGTETVSLSGDYFLGTGFVYQFPPFSDILPGTVKIIASNEIAFQQKYGFFPAGQFTRNLSNNGEKLVFGDAFGNVIDYVKYSNMTPWPDADSTGYYIELTVNAADNNDGANWVASMNALTSAENPEATEMVNVYPNPVKDIVHISSSSLMKSVSLYDLQGRKIITALPGSYDYDFDIRTCTSGIYYMKIISIAGSRVLKVIRQ